MEVSMGGLLEGKKGVVLGVANKRSIAWAIAEHAMKEGARLCLTYQNERFKKQVEKLVQPYPDTVLVPCDVSQDEEIEGLAKVCHDTFGTIDFLVHSLAFAHKEDLEGPFYNVPRDHFFDALNISAYSLVALVRILKPLFAQSASVLTMTYLGGERVVPNYNIMGVAKAALDAIVRYLAWDLGGEGVRVNAISAGPIRTLASAGISQFQKMLEHHRSVSPLRENVTQDDVARTAVFLLSEASRGMTGTIVYVDAGYHIMAI